MRGKDTKIIQWMQIKCHFFDLSLPSLFLEKIMINCCFRVFDLHLSQIVCIGDKSLQVLPSLTQHFYKLLIFHSLVPK